jgi:hypothetical protein
MSAVASATARCASPRASALLAKRSARIAPYFIRVAEAEARKKGVDNARFVIGDAQAGDLRGPRSRLRSLRHHVLEMPGAAMRNAQRARAARLRNRVAPAEENPWLHEAELA